MNRKPRIFIGSSVESLNIADAINLNLDHQAEVTIWRNGTFDLSSNTIDSLIQKSNLVDFAIFIFSPDDIIYIKDQRKVTVRDNVLFELGLFIGAIGKERCFIIKPRNVDLHFPTDLLGITPADYESNRSDGDLASALNHPCALIKQTINKLQTISNTNFKIAPKKQSIHPGEIKRHDYVVLGQFVSTLTEDPIGKTIYNIKQSLNVEPLIIDLSVIRLEHLGYLEKKNETDMNGNEFYTYRITLEGIELIMKEEHLSYPASRKAPFSFNDDIPF